MFTLMSWQQQPRNCPFDCSQTAAHQSNRIEHLFDKMTGFVTFLYISIDLVAKYFCHPYFAVSYWARKEASQCSVRKIEDMSLEIQ